MIWKQAGITIDALNAMGTNTMGEWLQMEFTEIGEDYLRATMNVGSHVHQPMGLLHGGASAALAETLGSVASWLCLDPAVHFAVGMEINCNHIRGKKDGVVTGTVRPLHLGATSHVWDIKITDERDKLICVSRLTVAVRKK